MNSNPISQEKLNAFVDNQLASEERADVIAELKTQPQLSRQLNELQELKEWVRMAYQDPPQAQNEPFKSHSIELNRYHGLAASLLILISGLLGWLLHTPGDTQSIPSFHELASADSAVAANNKVLIHISKMDKQRIEMALNKAEQLLQKGFQEKRPLQLEVVANAQGLGLLRENSPYSERIASLSNQYDNIAFLACGIAMQNVRLSEGIDEVKLLPQAQQIDAALEQILRRLKAGWAYVRG